MEYFVAEKIVHEIESGNALSVLCGRPITPEIMGFVVDLRTPEFSNHIAGWSSVVGFDDTLYYNATRYFARLPVAESVEYFLQNVVSPAGLSGKTYRAVFEHSILGLKSESAQDVSLALLNAMQMNPHPRIREMAKTYIEHIGWGEIDQVAIFSALLKGKAVLKVARELRVALELVEAMEKEW